MAERTSHTPFRETIKDAPEFIQPFEARTLHGLQHWPFAEITQESDSPREKIDFEAQSIPDKELPAQKVRISYEAPYGLKARRMIVERMASDQGYTFEGGEVRHFFDDIQITYSMSLRGPFVTQGLLDEPRNFEASIYVTSGNDPETPPIARLYYDFSSQIPIDVRFPYADFNNALKGDVEKREKKQFTSGSYRETYFQWEHLVGAKVGVSRYDHPEDADRQRYYKWLTRLNSPEAVKLEDSPYKSKISRSPGRWLAGRLRFSRMNEETGESWTFSVPDWVNIDKLHSDIQYSSLEAFFYNYPAIFCVKNRGKERQWYSTWGKTDKTH